MSNNLIQNAVSGIKKAKKQMQERGLFVEEANKLDLILERTDSPLLIMVMGEFSTGKSTFINALVGKKITVVDALPTTAVITKLCYGEKERVIVHDRDGSQSEYEPDDFGRLTAESDEESNRLHEKIDYVERRMPLPVLKEMNIIDSPGLNALKSTHTEATQRFVSQADTVIWMISSEKAATESEYGGIEKLTPRLKPIVIVNKMDLLDEEEDDPEDFLQNVYEKLKEKVQTVIGISAEWAFEGKTENDADKLKMSNFSAFDGVLETVILPNRDTYKTNSLIDDLSAWLYNLMGRIKVEAEHNKLIEDKDYENYIKNQSKLAEAETAAASIAEPLKNFCQESTNNPSAMLLLGVLYEYGLVLLKSHEKAFEAYEKSAVKNNGFARYIMGDNLFKQEEYQKAFYWLTRSADTDYAPAQARLGMMYFKGLGTKTDVNKAKEFLEKAEFENTAENWRILGTIYADEGQNEESVKAYINAVNMGDIEAEYLYGMCLLHGKGIEKNYDEALNHLKIAAKAQYIPAEYQYGLELLNSEKKETGVRFLERAASKDYVDALNVLGKFYLARNDFPNAENYLAKSVELDNLEGCYYLAVLRERANPDTAMELYLRAADGGFTVSQGKMARLCYDGHLTKKDDGAALYWAEECAAQGNLDGRFILACLNYDEAFVDMKKEKGLQLLNELANENFADAVAKLGGIARKDGDYEKALALVQKAQSLSADSVVASAEMGQMLFYGQGVEQNKAEAVKYLAKAAQDGNTNAKFLYALMLLNGDSVSKDQIKAAKLLHDVAEVGDTTAQFLMGRMYENGEGVTKDPKEARRWYELAVAKGHAMAMNNLGQMLKSGMGGAADLPRAFELHTKAAEMGVLEAKKSLVYMYYNGMGTAKDEKKAVELMLELNKTGKADANILKLLGNVYYEGKIVTESKIIAKDFYLKAYNEDKKIFTDFELLQVVNSLSKYENYDIAKDCLMIAAKHGNNEAIDKLNSYTSNDKNSGFCKKCGSWVSLKGKSDGFGCFGCILLGIVAIISLLWIFIMKHLEKELGGEITVLLLICGGIFAFYLNRVYSTKYYCNNCGSRIKK